MRRFVVSPCCHFVYSQQSTFFLSCFEVFFSVFRIDESTNMPSGYRLLAVIKASHPKVCYQAVVASILLQSAVLCLTSAIYYDVPIFFGYSILFVAIVSLLALTRGCVGNLCRVLNILIALGTFSLFASIAASLFFFVATIRVPETRLLGTRLWKEGVNAKPHAICLIETAFKCRAFLDSTCLTETCASCPWLTPSAVSQTLLPACYDSVVGKASLMFMPPAAVLTVAAVFVLVDSCVTCALFPT